MKLLITGGHLTPALSFLDFVKKQGDEVVFVGRQHSSKDHQIESHEKAEVENRQAHFEYVDTVKINRHEIVKSLLTLPKIITSILTARKVLIEHQPDIVVSFGGYVAVPVVIAAKTLSIPIFTHEQTMVIGLANKVIALLADKVGTSWPQTHGVDASPKYTLTGNPIRYELKQKSTLKPDWVTSQKPILYITGGSQGSKRINAEITAMVSKLVPDYYCIHQCGSEADFVNASQVRLSLPEEQRQNYTVRTWFSAVEVAWILSHAMLVIGRAGANTVSELIEAEVPSILIPLPNAGQNEQYLNAFYLSERHAALLLPQPKLNQSSLFEAIKSVTQRSDTIKKALKAIKNELPKQPEEAIYKTIQDIYAAKHN